MKKLIMIIKKNYNNINTNNEILLQKLKGSLRLMCHMSSSLVFQSKELHTEPKIDIWLSYSEISFCINLCKKIIVCNLDFVITRNGNWYTITHQFNQFWYRNRLFNNVKFIITFYIIMVTHHYDHIQFFINFCQFGS